MIILYTLLFWLMFVALFSSLDEDEKKFSDLPLHKKALSALFIIVDVLYNFVYGTLLFLEPPSFKRPTLTQRMLRAIWENKGTKLDLYRQWLAIKVCKYLVEPWDWGHCRLYGKVK